MCRLKSNIYGLLWSFSIVLLANLAHAQLENHIWYFGENAGINFNTNPPTPLQTGFVWREGMSTVCNPTTGEVLFSTNGASVWTRFNTLMPNGTGLLGNKDNSLQGVVVVPMIDSPSIYYIFSLEHQPTRLVIPPNTKPFSDGLLYYSVLDMSLNNGLGDIVPGRKNILLDSLLGESLIAIPGSNCDVWLVGHKVDTTIFKAWHFDRYGFHPNPVISSPGNQISGLGSFDKGCMASSPDGSMLAITAIGVSGAPPPPGTTGSMVCRFNGATGEVTDGVLVEDFSAYGIAFSPDNKLLYINNWDPRERGLAQYNLSTWSQAAIRSSKVQIDSGTTSTYLRRFGDKIYTHQQHRRCLGSIEQPNTAGINCNYSDSTITLFPGTRTFYALPTDVVYPFPKDTLKVRTDTALCAIPQPIELAAPSGYEGYLWNDGSPLQSKLIAEPGTYWVISGDYCHSRVDTFIVSRLDTVFSVIDSFICPYDGEITLTAPAGYLSYLWDDQSTNNTRSIQQPGLYWVYAAEACVPRIDSFYITEIDFSKLDLGPDSIICNGEPVKLYAEATGLSYLWQDGSTSDSLIAPESGTYWVKVWKGDCSFADTIHLSFINLPQNFLPDDTLLCREKPFFPNIPLGPEQLLSWNDGLTSINFPVVTEGTFYATISESICSVTDTIQVLRELCDCRFMIPNAFSPNGDGRNDTFRLVKEADCNLEDFELKIFNRWGQLIYRTTDPLSGWDGNLNGRQAEMGTYMYHCSFITSFSKEEHRYKGDLQLLR